MWVPHPPLQVNVEIEELFHGLHDSLGMDWMRDLPHWATKASSHGSIVKPRMVDDVYT